MDMYGNPKDNIMVRTHRENPRACSLRSVQGKLSTLTTSIQCIRNPRQRNYIEHETKDTIINMEEVNLPLFTSDTIQYVENPTISTKYLNQGMNSVKLTT